MFNNEKNYVERIFSHHELVEFGHQSIFGLLRISVIRIKDPPLNFLHYTLKNLYKLDTTWRFLNIANNNYKLSEDYWMTNTTFSNLISYYKPFNNYHLTNVTYVKMQSKHMIEILWIMLPMNKFFKEKVMLSNHRHLIT